MPGSYTLVWNGITWGIRQSVLYSCTQLSKSCKMKHSLKANAHPAVYTRITLIPAWSPPSRGCCELRWGTHERVWWSWWSSNHHFLKHAVTIIELRRDSVCSTFFYPLVPTFALHLPAYQNDFGFVQFGLYFTHGISFSGVLGTKTKARLKMESLPVNKPELRKLNQLSQ